MKPRRSASASRSVMARDHVAEAIESILAQTFADFELIISDNASTDATPSICQAYAARDRRVRYHRHERNLGAAQQFQLRLPPVEWADTSNGRPTTTSFARPFWSAASPPSRRRRMRCSASRWCRSREHNRRSELYDHTAFGTARPRQSDRLAARLRARRCMDIFGVIRRDALRGTALIADHVGADRTLLIELALRGRFVGVPEALFVNRDHPGRFTRRLRACTPRPVVRAAVAQRRVLRTWILYDTCLRLVRARRARSRRSGGAAISDDRSLGHHRRLVPPGHGADRGAPAAGLRIRALAVRPGGVAEARGPPRDELRCAMGTAGASRSSRPKRPPIVRSDLRSADSRRQRPGIRRSCDPRVTASRPCAPNTEGSDSGLRRAPPPRRRLTRAAPQPDRRRARQHLP